MYRAVLRATYSTAADASAPRRALVVHKTSRLDYERKNYPDLTVEQMKEKLTAQGTAYKRLLARHAAHAESLREISQSLRYYGVEVRERCWEKCKGEDIQWSDIVFAAGGDGNFLRTAGAVSNHDRLVVGLNTDPKHSEGYLCMKPSPTHSLADIIDRIVKRKFQVTRRQRIRVSKGGRQLPVLALNEVFVGEKDPSHASYYELQTDDRRPEMQKSSGVLVYTGTGSTSWAYNMNKVSESQVSRVLDSLHREGVVCSLQPNDNREELVQRVTEAINESSIYEAEQCSMKFTVREPVIKGIFAASLTHGCAQRLSMHIHSWNTAVVMDGQFHFNLENGSVLSCQMSLSDALRTVVAVDL